MSAQEFPGSATEPLNGRQRAIIRAVAAGRATLSLSCEPDLFIDGLYFSDQSCIHGMVRAGLIRPARPGHVGERVPAVLTAQAYAAIDVVPGAA